VTSEQKKPRGYKDLVVWQKGMQLTESIYQITRKFPAEERFGLISQMRRAAVSIPSNIAEGQARNTTGEFIQFVSHAEGSLAELETQLLLSVKLKFCKVEELNDAFGLMTELRKMLNALRRALVTRHSSPVTRASSEEK
jgi:four helix bundle protein